MPRLLAALLFCFLALGTSDAHAQSAPSLSLSLIRAVRVSNTAITLSFKTAQPAIGKVAYTEVDGSKFTLTDSVPQTDHLFTIDQLDPTHGYSFVLSASAAGVESDTYTVLLAPESIGAPGTSVLPGVQETDAAGNVVRTTLAASSSAAIVHPLVQWWVFALLFVVFAGAWIGLGLRRRFRSQNPSSPAS